MVGNGKEKSENVVFCVSLVAVWRQKRRQKQFEKPSAHIPKDARNAKNKYIYWYPINSFAPMRDPPTKQAYAPYLENRMNKICPIVFRFARDLPLNNGPGEKRWKMKARLRQQNAKTDIHAW